MTSVSSTIEHVTIPTYGIGAPDKNPAFIDSRVYQGSTGKVYPYPIIQSITDTKEDKVYEAVILENEYIRVMVLPELGGRIQRAYDKTDDYDFVYYNHVIKPALVGLLGPWISGGIEFNWPQHHRPTTFMPVDYELEDLPDGGKSVLCHDVDRINGTEVVTRIALHPGKAFIEISNRLYNGTSLPQTFLWWANPAVAVNDHTQSVFPPDVTAVMDHGKRDVSRFPIATGTYYKHDYSEGVDISRYKNIPVPTSYMAEKSKYNFVGGYDYAKQAGLLHVADHHVSPGKKQWTWGCGDFGKAWDRNLTDHDGPYIELMTGVFTDNQPDFTWLKPFEEKTFTQYFMPYKKLGYVKNASVDAAVNLTVDHGEAEVKAYATSLFRNARITLTASDGTVLSDDAADLSPTDVYETRVPVGGRFDATDLTVTVTDGDGRALVSYTPEPKSISKLPEPAQPAADPEKIDTNEELYLTALHIEQYRHATYAPDPYYLEGLKRDPGDIRINNAYGRLLMRRGAFAQAEPYFRKAIKRLTWRNPNPYDSEAYFNLGLDLLLQGRSAEAYDAFFKATWSDEQQEMAFYYLAAITTARGSYDEALPLVDKALVKNAHNLRALGLKAYLLRKLGRTEQAKTQVDANLRLDPFDFVSGYEAYALSGDEEDLRRLERRMRHEPNNHLKAAREYMTAGAWREARSLLDLAGADYPMLSYYRGYLSDKLGEADQSRKDIEQAERASSYCCFPNALEDIAVLRHAIDSVGGAKAPYYLGCLYYDKRQTDEAVRLWEASTGIDPSFPTTHRNLALAYYNKYGRRQDAMKQMEQAFALDDGDAQVFLELDQLSRKLGATYAERLARYREHESILGKRDDLYIEYLTVLNMTGNYREAYTLMQQRRFHPWEGGEGKITTQYRIALTAMAKDAMTKKKWTEAKDLLTRALTYPENLGEGKLEGQKDNDLHYYLGLVEERLGHHETADKHFRAAQIGTDEPAGAMFYNDQPADMILYQGLAYLRQGELGKANARFYRLLDYGEQHLDDKVRMEYFAVSLPDFLTFDADYTLMNRVHCNYLMALANIGLGHPHEARKFLAQALELDPSHIMANVYADELDNRHQLAGETVAESDD